MGENQALGTFISTEKGNRYAYRDWEYYLRVVNNSDEYRYSEVERAKKWLKENPEDDDMYEEDPPF